MLDQIKRKRLNLTHEFEANRARINSSEKRKEIEANLQKFKKDVQNSKPNTSYQSAKDFYKRNDQEYLNQSPTMKDLINPFLKPQSRKVSEEIESPRFKETTENKQKLKEDDHGLISIEQRKAQEELQRKESPKKFEQPQSPLAEKEPQIKENQPERLERQISFGGEELKPVIQLISPRSLENSSNKFQPTYKREQSPNELNFNYNDSNYGGSSNGSSAIFFTSQFKQYLNRQKPQQNGVPPPPAQIQPITQSHKKSEPSDHHSQTYTHTDKQIGDSFLKIGEEDLSQLNESRSKKMTHNQSGRSLAFSNNDQSMLRESKANEYVHDMLNKKLDEELVLEISDFGKNKMKELADKYDKFTSKSEMVNMGKDLTLINGLLRLKVRNELNLKRYCFDGFFILKEYKFEEVKNEIKADSFRKQANQKLLRKIFQQWRNVGLKQQKKIIVNVNKRDEKMKKNIFQVFKMIWFDSKVKRQVDLYYLSKIFSAFKNAAANERKRSQNVALKQYCKSLKRRYFQKLQQGIEALRVQRMNQELAQEHHRAMTLRKYFNGWLQECSKSPQYVSLTMTSKNVFKQSADNRWLGIKTVDFKQLKE